MKKPGDDPSFNAIPHQGYFNKRRGFIFLSQIFTRMNTPPVLCIFLGIKSYLNIKKMKLLILILFSTCCLTGFAQTNGNLKTIPAINYWSDGKDKLMSKGLYIDELQDFLSAGLGKKRTGHWQYYTTEGKLNIEGDYDEQGEQTGEWKKYHENGKVFETGEYKKGRRSGSWIIYDKEGNKISEVDYYNGIMRHYYKKRKVKEELFFYRKGTRGDTLVFKQYIQYYENGNKRLEGKFDEYTPVVSISSNFISYYGYAKPKGVWTNYWENGKPATAYDFDKNDAKVLNTEMTEYKDDQGGRSRGLKALGELITKEYKNSYWLTFAYNQYEQEINFHDPKCSEKKVTTLELNPGSFTMHGIWEYWNSNNVLESKIEYNGVTNLPTGKAVYYFPNGKIKREGKNNEDGKATGEWISYFENGQVMQRTSYEDGKIIGSNEYFNPNGKPLGKQEYADGSLKSLSDFFDETGKPILKSGNGYIISYHPNGTISGKVNLLNAQVNGLYQAFYETGKMQSSFTYSNGKLDGEFNEYFENGALMSKGNYTNERLNGVVVYYHPNGKKLGSIKYSLDKPETLLEFFDENGKQILSNGTGVELNYHRNGKIMNRIHFTNSCRDGKAEWYYDNGQLSESFNFKYSEKQKPMGLWWDVLESYTRTGKKRDAGDLKNGKGTMIIYDENGEATPMAVTDGIATK